MNRALGLWDTLKHTNIHVMRLPERERRKRSRKIFEEIMAESFPNLLKSYRTKNSKQNKCKRDPHINTSQ